MRVFKPCNILDYMKSSNAICITTNGFVKSNGENVMGRGVAKVFKDKYTSLPKILGSKLKESKKNIPFVLIYNELGCSIVSFPTKPISKYVTNKNEIVAHLQGKTQLPSTVPGWMCVSDVKLIINSAHELIKLADTFQWSKIALPPPGCGNGGLDWDKEVKPALDPIFDDRFLICIL